MEENDTINKFLVLKLKNVITIKLIITTISLCDMTLIN